MTSTKTDEPQYCKTALLLPCSNAAAGPKRTRPMCHIWHASGTASIKTASASGKTWAAASQRVHRRPCSAPAVRSRPSTASRGDKTAAFQREKLVSDSWAKVLSAASSRPSSGSRVRPGSAPARHAEVAFQGKVGTAHSSVTPSVSWPCWAPALRDRKRVSHGDSSLTAHCSPWPVGAGWLLSTGPQRRTSGCFSRGIDVADIPTNLPKQTASEALSELIAKKRKPSPEKTKPCARFEEQKVQSSGQRVPRKASKKPHVTAAARRYMKDYDDEKEGDEEELSPASRWRGKLLDEPWLVKPPELASIVRAELGLSQAVQQAGFLDGGSDRVAAGDGSGGGSSSGRRSGRSSPSIGDAAEDVCTASRAEGLIESTGSHDQPRSPTYTKAPTDAQSLQDMLEASWCMQVLTNAPSYRTRDAGAVTRIGASNGPSRRNSKGSNAAAPVSVSPPESPKMREKESSDDGTSGSEEVFVVWANDKGGEQGSSTGADGKAAEIFQRLVAVQPEGQEISRGNLVSALYLLGYWYPDSDLVDDIVENVMQGKNCLDMEGYLEFLQMYEQRQTARARQAFKEADVGCVGTISLSDLSRLLWRQRLVIPLSAVLEELLREARAEVLEHASGLGRVLGRVSLEEYLKIQHIISSQAGFTRREADELESLFKRYDQDNDGRINVAAITKVLSSIGLRADASVVSELVNQVDPNGWGSVKVSEFLIVMQQYRQSEIRHLSDAFDGGLQSGTQKITIQVEDVPGAFQSLGYMYASPDLVSDVMAVCKLEGKTRLSFEDAYRVLQKMRENEGFPCAELDELRKLFEEYADRHAASVGLWEAVRVVQWMGYPVSQKAVQEAFEELDLHKRGQLHFRAFLKLVARFHDRELRAVRNVWVARNISFDNEVPASCLPQLLQDIGYESSLEQKEAFQQKVSGGMESEHFSLHELTRVAAAYRHEHAGQIRSNLLFTEKDINTFRGNFRKRAQKRTGMVSSDEVGILLDELCHSSRMVNVVDGQAQLRAAGLRQASSVDFEQFLKLVRAHLDNMERQRLARELLAVKETKFRSEEVQEFRAIFHTFDARKSGVILFADFARLISCILPAIEDEKEFGSDLTQIVCAVTGSQNRAYQLDFADFLRIMHRLQELNWRNINSSSAAIAAKLRRKASSFVGLQR